MYYIWNEIYTECVASSSHRGYDFYMAIGKQNLWRKLALSNTLMRIIYLLWLMSSMMEVHFAQNQDTEYLDFIEEGMLTYIHKCDKRMLGSFSALKVVISGYKARPNIIWIMQGRCI